jgi:hypothetical protein
MSDKELGQLRWAQEWASLSEAEFFAQIPPTQFEGIPFSPQSLTVAEERYILGFWSYVLAIEQFHKLNAVPDFFKNTVDVLIQRMQHYSSTWYWEDVSVTGVYAQEPFLLNNNPLATGGYSYPFPYKKEKDPARIRNTMYKNHLTQMIGLYQKLYGDNKWSEPGSISLTDSEEGSYAYDFHELVDLTYWEMKKEDAPRGPNTTNFFQELAYGNPAIANACVECEPNMCWAPCNTHVLISFKLHDEQFGTTYFEDIKPQYKQWMDEKNLYIEDDPDPDYRYRTAGWHVLKQDSTLHPADTGDNFFENLFYYGEQLVEGYPLGMLGNQISSSAMEGWTVTFMNSYSEDIWGDQRAHEAWSTVKARHYVDLGPDSDGDYVANAQDAVTSQIATPLFAALAGEAGDYQARDRMVTWSDKQYLGQWGNAGPVNDSPFSQDAYWFPPEAREHLFSPLSGLTSVSLFDLSELSIFQGAIAWTGTLVALGRANLDNGMRDLVQEPYVGMKAGTPKVRAVNWPNVKLRRAIYDESEGALIVTTGGGNGGTTEYQIYSMNPKKIWTLYVDNVERDTYFNTDSISVTVPHDGQDHDAVLVSSDVESDVDILVKAITDLGDEQLRLTVEPRGECVQGVEINGAWHTSSANETFTTDVDFSNTSDVQFTTYDCASNSSSRTLKVSGQVIESGLSVRYNPNGVWAIGQYIQKQVKKSSIHSALKAHNGGRFYDGPFYDIWVNPTGSYGHDSVELDVTPVDNSSDFDFTFSISGMALDVYKKSCFFCRKDFGSLTIDRVDISGRLRVAAHSGGIQVSILDITASADGSKLHKIRGISVLMADILGVIDYEVQSLAEAFSSALMVSIGAEAIGNLSPNLDLQVGTTTVNLASEVAELFNSYGGASIQLDASATVSTSTKPVIGSLYEPQLIPDGRLSPSGLEHEGVIVISSNMINQFYSGLNRAGELDATIDVTGQFMDWFGGEWSSVPSAARLILKPVTSPYITFTDTGAVQTNSYVIQGAGRVFLDGFTIGIEVKETSGSSYTEIGSAIVSASMAVDLDVDPVTSKLVSSFNATPAASTVHAVTETQAAKVSVAGIAAAVQFAVGEFLPEYANQLGSLELPELNGFRLQVSETWTIDKQNIAFGGSLDAE